MINRFMLYVEVREIHKTRNVVLKVVESRKIIAERLQIESTGSLLKLKIDLCQKALVFCLCLFANQTLSETVHRRPVKIYGNNSRMSALFWILSPK